MKTSSQTQSRLQTLICSGGLGALSLGLLLTVAPSTQAQPIYTTGFEPDAFLADTSLAGQDGWIAPPPLSPNAAIVTRDKPRQGRQTVHVSGAGLEPQDFINESTGGYYDAIGSYRRPVNHDTGNAQTIRVSAHVRLDGPATDPGDNFFSAALSTRAATTEGTASVGEIALSSDGHAYAYSGNETVPTFLGSVPAALHQWHNLAVVADFATRTSELYVDDQLLAIVPFEPTEEFTGLLLRGTLLAYAAPDDADHSKADYVAHYDQFAIRATGR